MTLDTILRSLRDCPCGKTHTTRLRTVEITAGCKERAAQILAESGFPQHILVAAQSNALQAADGILDVLQNGGFTIDVYLFDALHAADENAVRCVTDACRPVDGILSIGSGTVCDVCRRAAFLKNKEFAIFATAPSMDGFASDTAPILRNSFKISLPARQPSVILADTAILSAAPAVLRSAGFGDMLAKYVAIADWRIAHCLTGEYYCERIADLTRSALQRVVALADRITENDPQTAGTLMESLVLTGLAMQLCGSSRAAGGAEHVVSHFWESKQTERGERTDLHGRKVGAATVMIARLYYAILREADPANFCADATDWTQVYAVYGERFADRVRQFNVPSVLESVTPALLRTHWNEIRRIVYEEIPQPDTLDELLRRVHAARTFADVGVDDTLGLQGLQYHPYMRRRILLTRLLPMLGTDINYRAAAFPAQDVLQT